MEGIISLSNNKAYKKVKALTPGLFTENYIFRDLDSKEIIFIREPNCYFRDSLLKDEKSAMKNIFNANITHQNYASIQDVVIFSDFSNGRTIYSLADYAKYSLQGLAHLFQGKRMEEDISHFFFIQILDCVKSLKDMGINYLTLRYEDILLDEDLNLKCSDYGIANAITKAYSNLDWLKLINNKTFNLAPEVYSLKEFSDKSIVFNLGIILFNMVVGFPPFTKQQMSGSFKELYLGNFDKYWEWVEKMLLKRNTFGKQISKTEGKIENEIISPSLKTLLFDMLSPNAMKRPTLEQVSKNVWVERKAMVSKEFVMQNFQKHIKKYRDDTISEENSVTYSCNKKLNFLFGRVNAMKSDSSSEEEIIESLEKIQQIEEKLKKDKNWNIADFDFSYFSPLNTIKILIQSTPEETLKDLCFYLFSQGIKNIQALDSDIGTLALTVVLKDEFADEDEEDNYDFEKAVNYVNIFFFQSKGLLYAEVINYCSDYLSFENFLALMKKEFSP